MAPSGPPHVDRQHEVLLEAQPGGWGTEGHGGDGYSGGGGGHSSYGGDGGRSGGDGFDGYGDTGAGGSGSRVDLESIPVTEIPLT